MPLPILPRPIKAILGCWVMVGPFSALHLAIHAAIFIPYGRSIDKNPSAADTLLAPVSARRGIYGEGYSNFIRGAAGRDLSAGLGRRPRRGRALRALAPGGERSA